MKATIESTAQVVEIAAPAGAPRTQGRIWIGTTEDGVPVQLLVVRVAVGPDQPPAVHAVFARELQEVHAPVPEPLCFPLRMIL